MLWVLTMTLFGLVVGVITKLLTRSRAPAGFTVTILLGIAGASLVSYAGRALGFYGPDAYTLTISLPILLVLGTS